MQTRLPLGDGWCCTAQWPERRFMVVRRTTVHATIETSLVRFEHPLAHETTVILIAVWAAA